MEMAAKMTAAQEYYVFVLLCSTLAPGGGPCGWNEKQHFHVSSEN